MKNQLLSLLVLLALFGFTATGAQAHTTHGFSHGSSHGSGHGHIYHHHEFRDGHWCDWDDDCAIGAVAFPGFSINFNL